MDARWMPILAAAVGVLGGVGGALVGGFAANEGQEKAFERERTAAIKDLRAEAYGAFFGTAEAGAVALLSNAPPARIRAAFERLVSAKARVFLVADSPEVGRAAFLAASTLAKANDASTEEEERQRIKEYSDDMDHFLNVARDDIEATKE